MQLVSLRASASDTMLPVEIARVSHQSTNHRPKSCRSFVKLPLPCGSKWCPEALLAKALMFDMQKLSVLIQKSMYEFVRKEVDEKTFKSLMNILLPRVPNRNHGKQNIHQTHGLFSSTFFLTISYKHFLVSSREPLHVGHQLLCNQILRTPFGTTWLMHLDKVLAALWPVVCGLMGHPSNEVRSQTLEMHLPQLPRAWWCQCFLASAIVCNPKALVHQRQHFVKDAGNHCLVFHFFSKCCVAKQEA